MTDLLQLLLAGVSVGAVYALVAMGFTVIFSVSEIINLTQGEFAALAGLIAISATTAGLPMPLAMMVAIVTVVASALPSCRRFSQRPEPSA